MLDRSLRINHSENLLLNTLLGNSSTSIPVWLMRQAGRYLPEYQQTRSQAEHFLDFCYTPSLATEATLQPLRRFDLDAAIIFSDILVIPDAMGIKVSFEKGKGPVLEKKESWDEYKSLIFDQNYLSPVYEAIENVRSSLPQDKALIGFSGAPWTLLVYMLEGQSSKDFAEAKKIAFSYPDVMKSLLETLVEAIVVHLSQQIEAGVNCVKLFDSWAGSVPDCRFDEWIKNPIMSIVSKIKQQYPNVPIIVFPRGIGEQKYKEFVRDIGANCIAVDSSVSMAAIYEQVDGVLQGNIDPTLLFAPQDVIRKEVGVFLDSMESYDFVFNLGHGVLPQTPIEHVELLVNLVKERRRS